MNTEQYAKVLSRLQDLCAKRECCSSEIFSKALSALDGDREKAAELLESLKADGYVSDFRYASAFAREKAALTGWGSVKISYMLAGKGIAKDVISKALEEIDEESADKKMMSLLEAKKRSLEGDPQIKLKLIRFGLSRGYEYDKIGPAADDILSAKH